jgi:hypothetical protein
MVYLLKENKEDSGIGFALDQHSPKEKNGQ